MAVLDLFDLSGKAAIVTGGGRGLGYAMAQALAEAGAKLVVASRKEAACKEAAEALSRETGAEVVGCGCDITSPEDVEALLAFGVKAFDRIDILINNSGAAWGAPTRDYPLAGWEKVMKVNATGTFICSQIIGRHMIDKVGGKILNVGSIFGSLGAPPEIMQALAYNASKGAIEALTKDLAVKWAKHNIQVNNLAPAFIATDLTRETMQKGGEAILAHVPVRRFGEPEDLKGAVLFLCSAASDYVTGSTLFVDGGYRAM
jgi:NAD(P)-dependent dehydrogenase (short-subunit alcohol dehydrogenase family)